MGPHTEELFLTLDCARARQAAERFGQKIQARFRTWSFRPEVLSIDLTLIKPSPALVPELPEIDVAPYVRFFRDNLEPDGTPDDNELLVRIQCLHWFTRTTGQPAAIWTHLGWKGLLHECCLGVGGAEPILHFNEDERRSSLTAALWYLGVDVPDHSESYWIHDGVYAAQIASRRKAAIENGTNPESRFGSRW